MATSASSAASAAQEAASAWEKAPLHVKAMAGPYVKPLLAAVLALAHAAEEAEARIDRIGGSTGEDPHET